MRTTATQFISPAWVIDYDTDNSAATNRAFNFAPEMFYRAALSASDQLRLRVSWGLMQFIPVRVSPYGNAEHFNLLQRHALGNYGELLKEMSIHPAMGQYLNNNQNRPLSAQCPGCTPNENFARELMQLFSLGVVKLNPDGSTVRDGIGKAVETYSQKDVEELARALTGWRFNSGSTRLPRSNSNNAGYLMLPEDWSAAHDRNAKTILGTSFPAGRDAPQELDAAIAMLMAHPNIAPFVSLRLIQHLVTSNPSPQYLGRVSAVFKNNGQGVTGDMKAVVRAILLDSEARRGDQAGADSLSFGKIREPVLFYTAALRGLGCTGPLKWSESNLLGLNQNPFDPPSVFSFYLPTDRAPGSNLLSPEQRLLTTQELRARMGQLSGPLTGSAFTSGQSGCDMASLVQAFSKSSTSFVEFVSARWFRSSIPPTLRTTLLSLYASQSWGSPEQGALTLLQFALSTPYFGVVK